MRYSKIDIPTFLFFLILAFNGNSGFCQEAFHVNIGSNSSVEKSTIETAFQQLFPNREICFTVFAAESEITTQVVGIQSALQEAQSRLNKMKELASSFPETGYWIAVENFVEMGPSGWQDRGLVIVEAEKTSPIVEVTKAVRFGALSKSSLLRDALTRAVLKTKIDTIPDFPKKGIVFRDMRRLLLDPEMHLAAIRLLAQQYQDQEIDLVAGLDARGLILGAPLALEMKKPFFSIRKKGKLSESSFSQSYEFEYSQDSIEISTEDLTGKSVLLIDDLLASGETLHAAEQLLMKAGAKRIYAACLIELLDLGGRATLHSPFSSVLSYKTLTDSATSDTLTIASGPTWNVAMTVGPDQSIAEKLRAKLEQKQRALDLLEDKTILFENDNTFVQLFPKGIHNSLSIVKKHVWVILPEHLSYNQWMEALIKVRAARTFGANQVSVYSDLPLEEQAMQDDLWQCLNPRDLLATAGADRLVEGDQTTYLHEPKRVIHSVRSLDYWIGSSNHLELTHEIADILSKPTHTFEEILNQADQLKGRKIYWVAASHPPVNESFFKMLAQIRCMQSKGASVHLVSPYLPYARSDKPDYDVGATAQGRLIADLIESVGTKGITVVRAHAPQSLGFFKIHAVEISGRTTLVNFLKAQNIDCIISPDAGFQKDATKYQAELNLLFQGEKEVCLAVMNKERDVHGKERILGGTGLEQIKGKDVVVIDDETSSGGTLNQVAQTIQAYQPRSVFAVVTHLAGPARKSLNSEFIKKMVVTNTLPSPHKDQKLTVLSVAAEIANEIARAESNRTFF